MTIKRYKLAYYIHTGAHTEQEIINLKNNDYEAINKWNNVTKLALEQFNINNIDYIVRALGSKEVTATSLKPLDLIAQTISSKLDCEYVPERLRKKSITEPLKFAGNKINRNCIIKDSYIFDNSNIKSDSTIMILDDLYTTGATTEEIIRSIHKCDNSINIVIFTLLETVYRRNYTFEQLKKKEEYNEKFYSKFLA